MSSLSGGLIMISEVIHKLPPSEARLAAYIIENPSDAINCTASELGEKSATSASAVIRLCKSLGIKGYQELKLRVAGDLQKANESEGYRDIRPMEKVENVIGKMTNNSIQALRETSEILLKDELSKAVEMISSAGSIHFFGIGASHIIAQDAQQKFLRIHKNATAFSDLHIAAVQVANTQPGDVVVGISFSGESIEVVKILELAKMNGATTISLTSFGSSSVSDCADIKLYTTTSKEALLRSAATSSRLAQLHVIDILFMCVTSQNFDNAIKYIDQTREAVNFIKDKLPKKQFVNND
jgi:DNA-binding MurR/RpiR family transcriptional regulator